jgi:nitrite reductase/ring-hydroxylating ferredoxin subunit
MPSRYKVGTKDELTEDGDRIITEVNGQEIAVIKYQDELYALANFCIHQSGPLCEGEITGQVTVADDGWDWRFEDEGKCISCPWHGWTFDITTGKSVKDPDLAVPSYDVEIEEGEIFVLR